MRLKNKNILIFGLGRSGKSVMNFLTGKGANIFLYDNNEKLLKQNAGKYNVNLYDQSSSVNLSFAVLSPGIKHSNEMLIYLRSKRVKIISEIEFAYRFCKGKVCAITGTNGKTTCVNLLYQMLRNNDSNTFIAGNVGIPFSDIVENMDRHSIVSLEVSSFQMENIEKFRPKVASILNLSSDHMDSYDTFDDYVDAKLNITRNQKKSDIVVVNFDDEILMKRLQGVKSTIKYFSINREVEGVYLQGESIYYKSKNKTELICDVSLIKLKGMHNVSNVLACICMAKAFKIDNQSIIDGIKDFKGMSHRLEFAGVIGGVQYINDSKATNINSSLVALDAFKGQNIHLLVGGSDKGENFDELFQKLDANAKVYIFGATKQQLINSAKKAGWADYMVCENMLDSCALAKSKAVSGDVVLLSPACASFDEFKNYEERGDTFKRWVSSLEESR